MGRFTLATALALLCASGAAAQTTIRIDGSTGAMPLVAALAKDYEAARPGIRFQIGQGLGTRERIDALTSGTIDIAVASHGLKVDDLTARGMTVTEVARTAVVFAVNASVALPGLSSAQLCDIYAGKATNWKGLGGPDAAIAARTRPDSEVDAEVVRAGVACLKALKMPETVKVMPRGGDMARELAATAGAVGMTSATVVEQSNGRIRTLMLDGTAASDAAIASGAYKLVRETFLVTGAKSAPAVAEFIAFVRGSTGAAVIKRNGAIPRTGGS